MIAEAVAERHVGRRGWSWLIFAFACVAFEALDSRSERLRSLQVAESLRLLELVWRWFQLPVAPRLDRLARDRRLSLRRLLLL